MSDFFPVLSLAEVVGLFFVVVELEVGVEPALPELFFEDVLEVVPAVLPFPAFPGMVVF